MLIPTRGSRALTNPASFYTTAELDKLVGNVTNEEAAMRDTAGAIPMDDGDRAKLRGLILFKICAEAQPAGNC